MDFPNGLLCKAYLLGIDIRKVDGGKLIPTLLKVLNLLAHSICKKSCQVSSLDGVNDAIMTILWYQDPTQTIFKSKISQG